MPGLPGAHRAIIDEWKITRYLLAGDHPAGRAKAAFFERFGFHAAAWQVLRDALFDHAGAATVQWSGETPFGMKYVVEGAILAPDGRQPKIRAVWFVPSGEDAPRLVTAYALSEASDDQ